MFISLFENSHSTASSFTSSSPITTNKMSNYQNHLGILRKHVVETAGIFAVTGNEYDAKGTRYEGGGGFTCPATLLCTKICDILLCQWRKLGKGKAIPLQALTDPEGSRLRLPNFKTICTWRWQGCQPYALAAFTPRKYCWYSFLLRGWQWRK
jgi:hypothetical protein